MENSIVRSVCVPVPVPVLYSELFENLVDLSALLVRQHFDDGNLHDKPSIWYVQISRQQ